MPISSGAEGHVGVGVDTSIKWIPDGGTDSQTPRDVNSYLQRYLDSLPQARKRNIEGRFQRAGVQDHQEDQDPLGTNRVPQDGANHHEALLETKDSQLVTSNQNTTKADGKTPKREIQQEEGAGSPRISGTDDKTPKQKNEQDLASPRKSDVKTQKLKNGQEDDLPSTRKSEHEAYQGHNEEAQYREAQPDAQASSPAPAESTPAAKDGGPTKGKGSKTGAKSSTCTVL